MAFYVEAKQTFSKAPAGQYQAVCAETVDLGITTKEYKNDAGEIEPRQVHQIQYVFQLNKVDPETGRRYEVRSKPLNLNLSEKSALRAFLLQWRGHDLTAAELNPPGLDVDLKGRNAQILVIHNQVGEKSYANIGSIMPLMEGVPEIAVDENYQPKQSMVNNASGEMPSHSGPATAAAPAAAAPAVAVPTPNAEGDIPF